MISISGPKRRYQHNSKTKKYNNIKSNNTVSLNNFIIQLETET